MIRFYLKKSRTGDPARGYPIEFRISCNGESFKTTIKCRVPEANWDASRQECKPNRQQPWCEINRLMSRLRLETANFEASVARRRPSRDELRALVLSILGAPVGDPARPTGVMQDAVEYLREKRKQLAPGSYRVYVAAIKRIKDYGDAKGRLTYDSLCRNNMAGFADFLFTEYHMRNSTAIQSMTMARTFVKWARKKGYHSVELPDNCCIKTRHIDGNEAYLSWDEFLRMKALPISEEHESKRTARDMFCLACATSLRYSDITALTPQDVDFKDGTIRVVTKKTKVQVFIPMNEHSREILKRRAENRRPGERIFRLSPYATNLYISQIAEECGFTDIMTRHYYKEDELVTDQVRRCDILSIHDGRRTFVVHALELGWPEYYIRSITGHKSPDALKPYMNALDSKKTELMKMFDGTPESQEGKDG